MVFVLLVYFAFMASPIRMYLLTVRGLKAAAQGEILPGAVKE